MTDRDPRFPRGWWIGAAIILGAIAWLVAGVALSHAAESRRGASPTAEQVDACQNGLDALCEPENAVSVELTERLRAQLEAIHDGFRRDAQRGWFDCDGYVLHAIEALARIGVPRGSMAWGSGWTAEGVHHAWLVVRTSGGEIVMDPLRKDITWAADMVEYSQVKWCDWVDVEANKTMCWK